MKPMFAVTAAVLGLAACAAQGLPVQENVAGAPTTICSTLLAQEAQSLQQLKAVLDKTP